MGTLGVGVDFFLGGVDLGLAVVGEGSAVAGEALAGGGLAVAGASSLLSSDLAAEVILACSSACSRRSERDCTFRLSFLAVTTLTTSLSSVTACSRTLAGDGLLTWPR